MSTTFLKAVLLLLVATATSVAQAQSARPRKPNLLFLWTDEQAARTTKAYGNHKIQTPNLDALAATGTVFKNAYVSQPVCTPSRATVMTGLWPTQSTMVKNGFVLPPTLKCFPELVGDADYRTGYFGKWHLGDEQFAQHGFQEWVSMEEYRNYSRGREEIKLSDYWHFLTSLGYTPDTAGRLFSRDFAAKLPLDHSKTRFLERHAIDFLTRHRDAPFILYVNFLEPHMPFTGPLDGAYDPASVDLPPNFDDPVDDDEPVVYRNASRKSATQPMYGFTLRTEEQWRHLIANYWGLTTQIDRSVGAILDALERLGLADDTIVVFTSDHGDMMGAHRMLAKDVMYEESAKVPWIIRVPGRGWSPRTVEQPVSHIDLVPTLLELMQAPPAPGLPGKSLVPLMKSPHVAADHVFIQWNGFERSYANYETKPDRPAMPKSLQEIYSRAVVSPDGWKLNLTDCDRHQLFDLRNDPYETRNLYYTDRHQDVIARLTRRIHEWQASIGDKVRLDAR